MYLIDYLRTPIGKFLGSLAPLSAPSLAIPLIQEFVRRYPVISQKTDQVILGQVIGAGTGMNPSRLAAVKGGLAVTTPAFTINQVCASGMSALIQGHQAITTGTADLIIAGGMESMSNAPYILSGARQGFRFGHHPVRDSLKTDGLVCGLTGQIMGLTGEYLAHKYAISRQDQDKFSLFSHRQALAFQAKPIYYQHVIPVGGLTLDEGPRPDTSLKRLADLKPVFKANGTVTAGNASTLNDGAAAFLLASPKAVKRYALKPKAKILGTAMVGVPPRVMGLGAKFAIERLLKTAGIAQNAVDLWEINEAFAAQVLAVVKLLDLNPTKLNLAGGAIALGHPLGMSGARIVGQLLLNLDQANLRFGVASICVGGGQGAAILIERL